MKVITLQRPAVCTDCEAEIPAGARARYYSADRIYCESHDEPATREPAAKPARTPASETEPLFQDDTDIEVLIQFLEEVQHALTTLIHRLRATHKM